jgi:glucosamine 6-phosphate synthetase-like amidotransferase/phosphosugar isomerase protein
MCGLVGYYCFGTERPDRAEFERMMISCQVRGTHATGVAWLDDDGTPNIIKSGIPAKQFIKTAEFKALELPRVLMAHTRYGTKGGAHDNKNNHPLYDKGGLVIAHNGIVRNDDLIFERKGYQRDGQVDSEVILRVVAQYIDKGITKAAKSTSIIDGSFAVSMLSRRHPDKLILFAHDNPIELAYDKDKDILYYGSTRTIINAGFMEKIRGFEFAKKTLDNLHYTGVSDDECMIIGKGGVEKRFWFYDEDKVLKEKVDKTKYLCTNCLEKFDGTAQMSTYNEKTKQGLCTGCMVLKSDVPRYSRAQYERGL